MKFKEIEFKYKADYISLADFTSFCVDAPKKTIAAGYDYFYVNKKEPDVFCRYRVGPDINQFTFKRKLSENNNYIRDENNINLTKDMGLGEIESICLALGYEYVDKIFKTCFIYKYDLYTYVYYICYDVEMKELGRFIEVELCEEHDWGSESNAWNKLTSLESELKEVLGIIPQARVKRSLFEMYIKSAL